MIKNIVDEIPLKSIVELERDELKKLSLEHAFELIKEMNQLLDKRNLNIQDSINEKLASGKCFIQDEILFYKENTHSAPNPIWFPTGNAIEWQIKNGRLNRESGHTLLKCKDRLEKLIESEPKKAE